MIRAIVIGLLASTATVTAELGVRQAFAVRSDMPKGVAPRATESRKTHEINVPRIKDGVIKGYAVMLLSYTLDLDALRKAAMAPDSILVDEAFRYVYNDSTIDFDHLDRFDLAKMSKARQDPAAEMAGQATRRSTTSASAITSPRDGGTPMAGEAGQLRRGDAERAVWSSATFCPQSCETGSSMLRTVRILIALPSGRAAGATLLTAALVALGVALAASPAVANQDYPPGLFEKSPVVPPGQPTGEPAPTTPSGPNGPAADAGPDGYDTPPAPGYDGSPPDYDVPLAPGYGRPPAPGYYGAPAAPGYGGPPVGTSPFPTGRKPTRLSTIIAPASLPGLRQSRGIETGARPMRSRPSRHTAAPGISASVSSPPVGLSRRGPLRGEFARVPKHRGHAGEDDDAAGLVGDADFRAARRMATGEALDDSPGGACVRDQHGALDRDRRPVRQHFEVVEVHGRPPLEARTRRPP